MRTSTAEHPRIASGCFKEFGKFLDSRSGVPDGSGGMDHPPFTLLPISSVNPLRIVMLRLIGQLAVYCHLVNFILRQNPFPAKWRHARRVRRLGPNGGVDELHFQVLVSVANDRLIVFQTRENQLESIGSGGG